MICGPQRSKTLIVAGLIVGLWAGTALAGATPAERCQAAKNDAAGGYAACRENAEAKLASTGDMTAYDAAMAKCETKYQTAWQRAEQEAVDASGACTTTGDQTAVQGVTDEYTNNVAQHLGGAPLWDCPGDLAACTTDRTTCNGSLSTCNGNLTTCNANYTSCSGSLATCTTDRAACNGSLSTCNGNLTTCNADYASCSGSLATCNAGTAATADVLSGKTFSSSSGLGQTGTMANNAAVTLTPGTADQAIAAGYHNGSGTVVGDPDLVSGNIRSGVNIFGVNGSSSVVDTSGATAAPGDMLSGQTAYVNGSLVTGSVPAGANVNAPNGIRVFQIPNGLYAGWEKANASDTNLVAGNIVSGVSIFGVAGTAVPAQPLRTGQTQCDQGAGTLGACPGSPAGQDGALLKGATRSYTEPSTPDGTITDNKTGLMWEKLSNDGSIHDYTSTYAWYAAFTTKIATLNTMNSGAGFANHTDWRLPNLFELETLVDLDRLNPAIDPVFNTGCVPSCTVLTCSCTQSDFYWSSTTWQYSPAYAWGVYFSDGSVNSSYKGTFSNVYVRAVRGGS